MQMQLVGSLVAVWFVGAAMLAPLSAAAEAEKRIEIEMMVSLASDEPGPIDPKAKRIHQQLSREFRYESLEVLTSKKERVAIDDVMSVKLPNGKHARVRPMSVDERGVLLAIDIEGAVTVDAKAKSGHLLVFGAGHHGDGRIVVTIEPSF